jgi:hypothetical protein
VDSNKGPRKRKGDRSTCHAGLTSALCYGENNEQPVLNVKLARLATSPNVTLVARLVDCWRSRSRIESVVLVGGCLFGSCVLLPIVRISNHEAIDAYITTPTCQP